MLSIETWLSFIAASIALCFTPGPTVLMVMGQALNHGKRSVVPLVTGTLCGDLIAMSASLLGISALLASSATLFSLLKWLGAGYLLFLGCKTLFTPTATFSQPQQPARNSSVFSYALIITALNPKGIIFFVAFLPMFIDHNQPPLPQMIQLALSFLLISALSVSFYTFFCGFLRTKLNSKRLSTHFKHLSAGLLISAGTATAMMQK